MSRHEKDLGDWRRPDSDSMAEGSLKRFCNQTIVHALRDGRRPRIMDRHCDSISKLNIIYPLRACLFQLGVIAALPQPN